MEDERNPLGRGERVHDDRQRQADGVGEELVALGTDSGIRRRLRREQPQAELERLLAPGPAAAEHVEADPSRHGRQPGPQIIDARAAGAGQAQVLMVALSNFFNRINTTLRIPAGTSWS